MLNLNAKDLLADEAIKIIETVRDAFLLLDDELRVVFANKSFYIIFKVTPEETIGKYIYDVGSGQWNIPELRVFIEETLSKEKEFHDYKVNYSFPDIGEKTMLLNGILVQHDHYLTLLVISDITAQEKAYNALRVSFESLEKLNKYMIGREVKMVELKAEIERLKKIIKECLPNEQRNMQKLQMKYL